MSLNAEWRRAGEWRCWNCREWVSNNELENSDGMCPVCDVEIDVESEPYSEDEQK